MKSFIFKIAGCASLAAMLVAMSAPPAIAVEAGGIGILPANPQPSNPLTTSWFIYEVDPGAVIEDAVILRNQKDTEVKVKLEAVDGRIFGDGTFGLLDAKSTSDYDIGSWTELEESELTLKPNSETVVNFVVTVPEDAEVGDHIGGLVVYKVDSEPDQIIKSGGAQVKIHTRVGARTYLTVLGDITRGFKLLGKSFFGSNKKIVFNFRAQNTGNVRNILEADIKIYNLFGLFDQQTDVAIGQVFPRQTIATRTVWPGKDRPIFGPYLAIMTIHDAYEPLSHSSVIPPAPKPVQTWTMTFFIPYVETFIFLLLLFMAWFVYQLVAWRRLYGLARRPLITHRIKKGDQLIEIAHHYGVSWKLLAKLNGIKPPYGLRGVKNLYIPDAGGTKRIDVQIPSFWASVSKPLTKFRKLVRKVYTIVIEKGDKKKDIEKFTGMTWTEIARYNKLKPSYRLGADKELKVPRIKKL